MSVSRTFRDRLVERRKLRGFSQAQLAEAVGIPLDNVKNYENRGVEPRAFVMVGLATALGCTIDYLLGLSDDHTGVPVGRYIVRGETIRKILATDDIDDLTALLDTDPELIPWWFAPDTSSHVVDSKEWSDKRAQLKKHLQPFLPKLRVYWEEKTASGRRGSRQKE